MPTLKNKVIELEVVHCNVVFARQKSLQTTDR